MRRLHELVRFKRISMRQPIEISAAVAEISAPVAGISAPVARISSLFTVERMQKIHR